MLFSKEPAVHKYESDNGSCSQRNHRHVDDCELHVARVFVPFLVGATWSARREIVAVVVREEVLRVVIAVSARRTVFFRNLADRIASNDDDVHLDSIGSN